MEITDKDPKRHPMVYHAAHSDGRSIMTCEDEECAKYARFMEVLRGSGYK